MADIYIGTSGWIYKHWRDVFYPADLPEDRWFEYYAGRFSTVEINNTFYRLPEASTFDGWRQQAPSGFIYTVKASRYITHLKKLKDPQEPVARFIGRARHLGAHLGPILYQLPPHWRPNPERLKAFLQQLPPDLAHVFEFREPAWFAEEILALLDEYGAGLAISDYPGVPAPVRTTGSLAYVRFHGSQRAYEGRYSDSELRTWARRIEGFLSRGLPTYVYFNNDAHGHAVHDALRLRELVEGTPRR